ncbi:MAG: hypothetical protein SFV23_10675 [Planctomycetaceae bacterium]|nr:hypothetical protein [Planctomycetaceae bacterium]
MQTSRNPQWVDVTHLAACRDVCIIPPLEQMTQDAFPDRQPPFVD